MYFVRLVSRYDYKLRVVDYRVIADIAEKREITLVSSLGYRRNM